jgi:hypothetical protein
MLKCGDTFLAPITSNATEHLWIVITDPDAQGNAVGVNITSQQSHSETTTILMQGDHPFVKHASVINYVDARIINVNAVQAAIDTKPKNFVCTSHTSCTPELLKKVQAGMLITKRAKKGIKQRCAEEWQDKQNAAAVVAPVK